MYISGNGELYDDEEVFNYKENENEFEDYSYEDISLEDFISFWEKNLRI